MLQATVGTWFAVRDAFVIEIEPEVGHVVSTIHKKSCIMNKINRVEPSAREGLINS